ncbi:uncharacterized protein MYCFIDRAFT_193726 [Pseudocercospora fijiensis CIRAD86]|uniref:Apple domain-containing protein n=1 Tax=Pseudocercospora fijiensis (strain CIRAD86) TaxID=383855 RepID=M3B7W8_PSEFD|nr:uncharacterized protein MYCFIDRAFT_193726 [Pseudocercospora fijiensis CIRAD86]EME85418.1 hypothetical protein MYCFIDRAFT_193726 [Pseudocercospora fijiensis CIRAD86]
MGVSVYFLLSLAATASLADARDIGLLRVLGIRQAETTIGSIATNSISTAASTELLNSTTSVTASASTAAAATSTTSTLGGITTSVATSTSTATTSTNTETETPLTCPASNGTSYTAPSGQDFIIECGIDHSGGDIGKDEGGFKYVRSLRECIDACDSYNGTQPCVDVSLSGSACYLKSVLGKAVPFDGLLGAKLANATTPAPPISCPDSNGTNYTTATNQTFAIECGKDFAGGDLAAQDVRSNENNENGELWLQKCIEACASTQGCVGASLSGSACYMKSQLGEAKDNKYVTGIRRLSTQPDGVDQPACDMDFPECSACDGVILETKDFNPVQKYKIECGVDHPGGDLPGRRGARGGYTGKDRFRNCIEDCAEKEDCVGVSFMGDTCYFKSSLGDGRKSEVVWGAVEVVG